MGKNAKKKAVKKASSTATPVEYYPPGVAPQGIYFAVMRNVDIVPACNMKEQMSAHFSRLPGDLGAFYKVITHLAMQCGYTNICITDDDKLVVLNKSNKKIFACTAMLRNPNHAMLVMFDTTLSQWVDKVESSRCNASIKNYFLSLAFQPESQLGLGSIETIGSTRMIFPKESILPEPIGALAGHGTLQDRLRDCRGIFLGHCHNDEELVPYIEYLLNNPEYGIERVYIELPEYINAAIRISARGNPEPLDSVFANMMSWTGENFEKFLPEIVRLALRSRKIIFAIDGATSEQESWTPELIQTRVSTGNAVMVANIGHYQKFMNGKRAPKSLIVAGAAHIDMAYMLGEENILALYKIPSIKAQEAIVGSHARFDCYNGYHFLVNVDNQVLPMPEATETAVTSAKGTSLEVPPEQPALQQGLQRAGTFSQPNSQANPYILMVVVILTVMVTMGLMVYLDTPSDDNTPQPKRGFGL